MRIKIDLGSASLATDGSGNVIANSEMAYKPFGGVLGGGTGLDTPYRFTNQRSDESATGLYDYNARFYSPVLGRFVSADSIVPKPSRPQDLNRYTYARNAPLRYTDPTGHYSRDEIVKILGTADYDGVTAMFGEGGKLAGKWGFLALLHRAQNGDSFYFYQYGMHPQGGMTPRARFVGIHFDGYKLSGAFYRDYDSAGSRPTLTNLPLPLENQLFVGDLYQLRRVSRGVDFNVATVRSDQQVRYRNDTEGVLMSMFGIAADIAGLTKGKHLPRVGDKFWTEGVRRLEELDDRYDQLSFLNDAAEFWGDKEDLEKGGQALLSYWTMTNKKVSLGVNLYQLITDAFYGSP